MHASLPRPLTTALAVALLLFTAMPLATAEDYGIIPQDDAGSGRDAPDAPSKEITIQPGIVYSGAGTGPLTDSRDYYHFTGTAGQLFQGWSDGNTGCYYLHNAQGEEMDFACSYGGTPINTGPLQVTLPYTGDYYFVVSHVAAGLYEFAFAFDEAPPDVRTLRDV